MNSGDDAVSVEPTLNPPGTCPPLSLVRINMLINGFMAEGGLVVSDQAGNLVSFNLAEVFVIHRAT